MKSVELLIIAFGAAAGAELYLENVKELQQSKRLHLMDVILVSKDSMGEVEVHETAEVEAGEGASAGALAGALIGLIGGPLGSLLGAALGGALGGITADQVDLGIPEDIRKSLTDRLKPGTSALLTLVEPEQVSTLKGLAIPQEQITEVEYYEIPLGGDVVEKLKRKSK
jgi:uncharacterized membrane protein